MLSSTERIAFIIMVLVFGGITAYGFARIFNIVRSSRSAPKREKVVPSMIKALVDVGLQKPIFQARPLLSTFHAFIFFGFSYYLLVNVTDVLEGFVNGFELLYGGEYLAKAIPAAAGLVESGIFNVYNLAADILSIGVLVGMLAFIIRRVSGTDKRLRFNQGVVLHPKVEKGSVFKDSYIVGGFIMVHVGSRFMGQVLRLARDGHADPFMPFASMAAKLFEGSAPASLETGIHLTWWLAIGLIVVFFPYFITSKHFHLMVAPLNLGLKKPGARGLLDPAVPQGSDASVEPGARTIMDLSWPRIIDAYACIMCNRCNDVCPAHAQGQVLSPAALEINKRYTINQEFGALSSGKGSQYNFTDYLISPDAVWACTTCYACVRVCPVGNEPMADIVDIRRGLIMEGADIDSGIQSALESLAKNGNWLGKGKRARSKWTKGLDFEIKDLTEASAEYLWFVGDTASYDERVIPLTQKVANILNHAGVDFGILYREERNSGNDVRRVGEEGLFEQLVEENLEVFGKSQFKQIFTTDPHSLNTLRNEYPQYGGNWPVHHYAQFILDLVLEGKLALKNGLSQYKATYHDPCYLGRYNGGFSAPRQLIAKMGINLTEMPRNKENSFCCGAGGGQIWLGSTPEGERPAESRILEALAAMDAGNGSAPAQKALFIVSCPKDVVMYSDAVKTTGNEDRIEVRDIIQLVEEACGIEFVSSAVVEEDSAA